MKPTALLLIGLVSLVGCGFDEASSPTPPILPHDTDAGPVESDATPQQMQPPVPDPLAASVCTDSVAVQGTALAGASVVVFGGATHISTDANPVTGRFCLDVPLVKSSVNTLRIHAQDPILGMSDPVTRTVTHSGNCGDDVTNPTPDPPKSKNVALGATGKASEVADEGNEGFLTDGDDKTFARYSGGNAWFAFNGWVYIKLDKVYSLDKIVVRWADPNGDYGAQYKVMVSSMSDPGDPNTKNGYWTNVADITSGDGGVDSFDLKSSKPIAQYVALYLEQDGDSWTWTETFSIAEIEVWDSPASTPTSPTTQSNTCASMGSGS